MTHPLRRFAVLAALTTTALLLLPAPAGTAANAQALHNFSSRFYEIHTNLGVDAVRPFGRHMDLVFAQYRQRFASFRNQHTGAMPLYLFRNENQYVRFMQAHGIDAHNSGGMFFVTSNLQGLATWTQGRNRSTTFSVLQHEGFHQFAYSYIGTDLPVWVNEGIAQYFEDAIITPHKMELGLADAQRIAEVRRAIADGSVVPLQRLVSITPQRWSQTLSSNLDRASLLYAQSWSVVYFVIHHNRASRAAFEQYLKLLSTGRASATAFGQAFGIDNLAPIQNLWEQFAKNQQPDPINIALTRLQFLGSALRYLHHHGQKTPGSIDQLRQALQARHFTLARTAHGITTRYSAKDAKLFKYPRPGASGPAPFKLLAPAADNLPPRVAAPGLDPEPMLVWSRNDHGDLVQDVDYR